MGDCGFFLTPMIGSWNVALSSAAGGGLTDQSGVSLPVP
jgi:hypothetical protein